MTGVNTTTALSLLKTRLNRLADDTTLDEYLLRRIEGVIAELGSTGIVLTDSAEDMMLVVDYAAYEYASRDKTGDLPDWLRRRIRYRWVQEVRAR